MVEEKEWYKSRTIWGALIAVLSSVIAGLGVTLDPASQSELTDVMVQLVGAIGAVVAIYGRLNATDVIA